MGCVSVQRGWLDVSEGGTGKFVTKWVVLDNGVLWIYREKTCSAFAEQVLPLHDSDICCPHPAPGPGPGRGRGDEGDDITLAVKLPQGQQGHRVVYLRAASGSEYRRWAAAMLEAAQLWRARRQMAELYSGGDEGGAPNLKTCVAAAPGVDAAQAAAAAAAARQLVAVSLVRLSEYCSALRSSARHAVTQRGFDDVLPRFHRRAVAAAVDRVWRATERARSVLEEGEDADDQGYCEASLHDAVLVLCEEAEAFVTYCSLLQDLKMMLRNDVSRTAHAAFGAYASGSAPIRGLSVVRDSVRNLASLVTDRDEIARYRKALSTLNAITQRCWTEICDQHAALFEGNYANVAPAKGPGSGSTDPILCDKIPPEDILFFLQENEGQGHGQLFTSPPTTTCFEMVGKRTSSVRKLASKFQRDIARQSVRRARRRARTDGQLLLPLPDLENSMELVPVISDEPQPVVSNAVDSGDPGEHVVDGVTPVRVMAPHAGIIGRPLPPTPCDCPSEGKDTRASELGLREDETTNSGKELITGAQFTATEKLELEKTVEVVRRERPGRGAGAECSDYETVANACGRQELSALWIRRRFTYNGEYEFPDMELHRNPDCILQAETEENIYEEIRDENTGLPFDVDSDVPDTPVTPATPNGGGRRALWCETMEVQRSGLLDRLNPSESALQEAKFEVLSSEESYLRSLEMLSQRMQSIESHADIVVMADQERDAVCKFLDTARACSLRFVGALRALWSRDVLLRGLCALMHREAAATLLQYPIIVGLQPKAASALSKIGSQEAEATRLLPLLSLPAQRATRLPLLLAAILGRLDPRGSEAVVCRSALDRLNQIVFECNESLRRAEHSEKMTTLARRLLTEPCPRKKTSWRERKNNVLCRAKSFFHKSNASKPNMRSSTNSLMPLTSV